jgi:glycosyltransferase involved in cell wall biosynthesis
MSRPVKVLVVGQTPPPYHGQALMIERLLRGQFARVQLYHVRMAFSDSIGDVGRFRIGKVFHLLGVIAWIIYYRTMHGVNVLYYPPAGPNRVPMYRDLVILNCTRWLFPRTIFHFHAGGVSELYSQLSRPVRWLFRRALFHADAAIRISHGSPEDGQKLQARREYVVPNGIEDEFARFQNVASDSAATSMAKLTSSKAMKRSASSISNIAAQETALCEAEPLRILFVGMLSESKGLLVLLEACRLLAEQNVPFQLVVVGQFQSPQFESQVRRRIDELGIESHVEFVGPLTDDAKWHAFAGADVLCLPTFYEAETFGVVLVEAMSFRLPVVATKWRGIPEIVDDGATGFLVEPHDAAAVADRLAQLQADPSLRKWLGAAGRRKFLHEFTTEHFLRRMEDVMVEASGQRCLS